MILLLTTLVILAGCEAQKKKQSGSTDPAQTRPNIVFIMTDDHAEQSISAFGHPISKLAPTPNIDRIAKNGALFRNNFCTNSLCGPSRAVILTGKHSHMNGFRMNGETFDGSQPTFPKYLQEAGYKTALFGKWHLHGQPQGFDKWTILKDQGNYYNPDFINSEDTMRIEGYATDIITEMDWSLGQKAVLHVAGTFINSGVLYEFLIRRVNLLRPLFGLKQEVGKRTKPGKVAEALPVNH